MIIKILDSILRFIVGLLGVIFVIGFSTAFVKMELNGEIDFWSRLLTSILVFCGIKMIKESVQKQEVKKDG